MKKTSTFILTSTWILFSRAYDAYCTHNLTPDLTKESNPLVSILNMNWTPLLLTIGTLTLYSLFCYFLVLFKPMVLIPSKKGYSFSQFIAYLYLGSKESWPAIFYKFPKDFQRFNHYMGWMMSKFLVYAGIVSTTMWLFINYTEWYKNVHSAAVIYSILIIGCILITYFWNKKLYKAYLKNSNKEL